MERIILLDYQTGIVHIFAVRKSKNLEDNVFRWCDGKGIHFSECEWMGCNEIIMHKIK